MGNKKLIYSVAIIFSVLFCFMYYTVFTRFVSEPDKETQASMLYMNQVGLYKSSDNAQNVIGKLKEGNIEAYLLDKGDVTAVVCSLSLNEADTDAQQEALTSLGYSYIKKNIEIKDTSIVKLLQDKEYAKALEMIQNESKGNNSE